MNTIGNWLRANVTQINKINRKGEKQKLKAIFFISLCKAENIRTHAQC